MAEAFLRWEAERRSLGIQVRSTGTHAWSGRAATIEGRRVMADHGVPLDEHRTLELDKRLVDWADLLIGMSREHARDVVRAYPEAAGRTYTMKAFLELLPSLPPYEDTESWLQEAARLRDSTSPPANQDIDDPIGERQEAYRRVAAEIRDLTERFADGLEDKRVCLQA
jgi:protein-tyrosine-phosphatase